MSLKSNLIFIMMVSVWLVGCAVPPQKPRLQKTSVDFASTSNNPFLLSNPFGRDPSDRFPEDPIRYFEDRNKARSLVSSGNCTQAVEILSKLIEQYKDDSSVWHDLATCQGQMGEHIDAITSYKEALELGTTWFDSLFRGEPSSIPLDIARQYSALEADEKALEWLQKALHSRYPYHDYAVNLPEFLPLLQKFNGNGIFGLKPREELSRDERWAYDLEFFSHKIAQSHVDPDFQTSADELSKILAEIQSNIHSLSDAQIVSKLILFMGKLGTGHDIMRVDGALEWIAVKTYFFSDGLYIIDAEEETLIGARIDKFGKTPTEMAFGLVQNAASRDNNMSPYWTGMRLLLSPAILEELGIIEDSENFQITITDTEGNERTLTPQLRSFADITPALSAGNMYNLPIYLSDQKTPIWYRVLAEDSLYIPINSIFDRFPGEFDSISNEISEILLSSRIKNVVLDLRHSQGGNTYLIVQLLRALLGFDTSPHSENIFVLIGRNTFSTAQVLIGELDKLANPIFVGEPSGGRPIFAGIASSFTLPFSEISVIIPTRYNHSGWNVDNRIWISPDIPVSIASTEYFSGMDPVLEVVQRYIEQAGSRATR